MRGKGEKRPREKEFEEYEAMAYEGSPLAPWQPLPEVKIKRKKKKVDIPPRETRSKAVKPSRNTRSKANM